jgi:hypothetical protein
MSSMLMSPEAIAAEESALSGAEPAAAAAPEAAPAEATKGRDKEPDYIFGAEAEEAPAAEDKGKVADKGKKAAGDAPKPKDEAKKEDRPETVPHAALHEERVARKQAEQRIQQLQLEHAEKVARVEERVRMISDAMQKAQQPQKPVDADPRPPDDDVVGLTAWNASQWEKHNRQQAEQAQRDSQMTEQQRQQAQRQQVLQRANHEVGNRFKAMAAQRPDLQEADQHILKSIEQQFYLTGHAPHTIPDKVAEWRQGIIWHLYQNNIPVEDYVIEFAKATGWRPPDPSQVSQGQQQQTQAAEQPRDPQTGQFAPKQETNGAAEKLAALAAAQSASDTLSNSGGGSPGPQRLTFESIDRMSSDEIMDMVSRLNSKGSGYLDKALEQMMGVPAR